MDTFAILAEPNRRNILTALAEKPVTVNGLVSALGMTQPSVSKHLRVLRDGGMVDVRQDAQMRWYGLHVDALSELENFLAPFRQHYSQQLDALERHLDTNAKTEDPQ
jgi:DNA-binding transcriptional ArsR family regulator